MKKTLFQRIVKCVIFVIITNLPFLYLTHLFGSETLFASFQHPKSYQYLKNDILYPTSAKREFLILEKSNYQGFTIKEGDTILYHTRYNLIQQRIVNQIISKGGVRTYYTTTFDATQVDDPVVDQQIIGKIKGTLDDNPWNALCLQIWDLSIDNLNAVSLFTNS